jgi:hypothetical protein
MSGRGIHRAAQRCLARVTANGGNRGFIHGGKLKVIPVPHLGPLAKAVILAKVLAPELPEPPAGKAKVPAGPATLEAQHEATAKAAGKVRRARR